MGDRSEEVPLYINPQTNEVISASGLVVGSVKQQYKTRSELFYALALKAFAKIGEPGPTNFRCGFLGCVKSIIDFIDIFSEDVEETRRIVKRRLLDAAENYISQLEDDFLQEEKSKLKNELDMFCHFAFNDLWAKKQAGSLSPSLMRYQLSVAYQFYTWYRLAKGDGMTAKAQTDEWAEDYTRRYADINQLDAADTFVRTKETEEHAIECFLQEIHTIVLHDRNVAGEVLSESHVPRDGSMPSKKIEDIDKALRYTSKDIIEGVAEERERLHPLVLSRLNKERKTILDTVKGSSDPAVCAVAAQMLTALDFKYQTLNPPTSLRSVRRKK